MKNGYIKMAQLTILCLFSHSCFICLFDLAFTFRPSFHLLCLLILYPSLHCFVDCNGHRRKVVICLPLITMAASFVIQLYVPSCNVVTTVATIVSYVKVFQFIWFFVASGMMRERERERNLLHEKNVIFGW